MSMQGFLCPISRFARCRLAFIFALVLQDVHGVNCSVQGCEQSAQRSMSGSKARMAADLIVNSDKRVYLCKTHYKEWKKVTKDDRENERARW
jgi:hypothetical protein